jgi:uncharacterized protein DUF3187
MIGRVAWRMAAGIVAVVLGLAATQAWAATELLGPLRIRDMTPFNLLRLDMLPAHAVPGGAGSWAIEADLSYSNTFVMSDNVRSYLESRGERGPLTQADVDAILAMGHDAYFMDGEFGLLDLTVHGAFTRRTSGYLTLSAYDFTGGFLDRTIEGFHRSFSLDNNGRDLVSRNRFQGVLSMRGVQTSFLAPPIDGGLGDPVFGLRHTWPLGSSRWGLVLDGAAKIAWRGPRLFLSTGTNDYGLQLSLQGKFTRQAVYLEASEVRTDGKVFGVALRQRSIPTLTAAYEVGVTSHTNMVVQLYASQSTIQDTTIPELKADKYQASLGARSMRGRLVYGFAVTENVENFGNTPDVGVSMTLAWVARRP